MRTSSRSADPATRPLLQNPTEEQRWILSSVDVARYCGVPHEEVLGWIDSGMLEATYLPPARYRILARDFMVFAERFDVLL